MVVAMERAVPPNRIGRRAADRRRSVVGQGMIEYALLLTLVAMAAMASVVSRY